MTIFEKCLLINRLLSNGIITFSNSKYITIMEGEPSIFTQAFIVKSSKPISIDELEIIYGDIRRVINFIGGPKYFRLYTR